MTEEELEQKAEEVIDFYIQECGRLCLKIQKLEKENEELKKLVSDYENKAVSATILKDEMRIKELEEQIEKMASCNNCKYFDSENYCKKKACIIHRLEGSCPNWELAE